MKKLDVPIACNLDAIESTDRTTHAVAWSLLQSSCLGSDEEAGAVALRYPARPELLAAAGEWIGSERLCCAFFDFELSVSAGASEFVIRVGTGPEVKRFVLENIAPAKGVPSAP